MIKPYKNFIPFWKTLKEATLTGLLRAGAFIAIVILGIVGLVLYLPSLGWSWKLNKLASSIYEWAFQGMRWYGWD